MLLLDVLKQYAAPRARSDATVADHFDSVVQQAPPTQLGEGIAAALRSEATPGIGPTVASLFEQSNSDQKSRLLNEILRSSGPAAATARGGVLARFLVSSGTNLSTPLTAAQAVQVPASDVGSLAARAAQQDDSLVDRLGSFYAQHPSLVKSLGVVSLGAIMSHMSQHARMGVV